MLGFEPFENKGASNGVFKSAPHGQIWALDALPNEATDEDRHQRAYFEDHGQPMLLDYAQAEVLAGERIVDINDDWVAVVPFLGSMAVRDIAFASPATNCSPL